MRILKWVVAVVVLLVAGAVIAVLTVDVNRFKPQIVAAVETATGRKLDIAQDMKLSLWPLGIGVKQVSFANAAQAAVHRWRPSASSPRRSISWL